MNPNSTQTLILSGLGTNCERETLHACRLAGAEGVRLQHLLSLPRKGLELDGVGLLVLSGGFLDGDDLGAARVCANRFLFQPLAGGQTAAAQLQDFIMRGGLLLGICNGFQLLLRLGLLGRGKEEEAAGAGAARPAAGGQGAVLLARNAGGRFENRWVRLGVAAHSPCVFTRGLEALELPVRCGEGRVLGSRRAVIARLVEQGLAPLHYCDAQGVATEAYPQNPCGSTLGVAALCNARGSVLGLMPHPEAFVHQTQHPRWTRGGWPWEEGCGLALLRNAYAHLAQRP